RSAPAPPETARRDEIGHLARALTQVRDELLGERLKREQSERLALLGQVATGLAHEIKNPLASIQLHAELMEAPEMDDESARSLQHVRAEAKVIEGLVNQWLYLTRPAPPQRVLLDLEGCLKQTLETVRGQAEHAGVTLIGSEAHLQLWTLGDRSRLQQAFRNVMLNAIQAMPGGGTLRVTTEAQGAEIKVSFQDAGPGFSATALERGTDLFFSEREGGMGVGLNVVAEIISAHDGHMALKNCPGGGAVVELCLPLEHTGPQSTPAA
ncbi:MAG: ATP-binding protein, partial [Prosthecobacter sp.]|nr:ATP-binding protein [Prosthecobacter sp.]